MDERIARVKTSQDARQLAENAQRLGRPDLAAQALERARELKALEEGYTSPAQQAIATALYAYEEEQSRDKERTFRAHRTRQMMAEHGALGAAERMVLHRRPSKGFEVLDGAGLRELSFEAIIDRFPNEFSTAAVEAARARLNGAPLLRPLRTTSHSGHAIDKWTDDIATRTAPDGEALAFLNGFHAPDNSRRASWLPRYRETISTIAQALSDNRPQDLFGIFWKTIDNSIANAGQGQLKYDLVDGMHEEFVQVIRDIHEDGSPANFEHIVERFEGWKTEGRISVVALPLFHESHSRGNQAA